MGTRDGYGELWDIWDVLLKVFIASALCVAVWGARYGLHGYYRGQCIDFCESMGDETHYSPSYGCFCEENGRRYNPEYLVPGGVDFIPPSPQEETPPG